MDITELLRRGLEAYGLDPAAAPALAVYCEKLLVKNREMNLTAITDPVDAVNLHMLDCAFLTRCAGFQGKKLIDVGTGAGFPGLVLKILEPSLEVTLLDSLSKRLDFLEEICQTLSLQKCRAVHARAEEASLAPAFREQYDFATARAVADLRVLCELCLPYVKVGGRFLAMKSTRSDEEIQAAERAIQILGGRLDHCLDYTIPGTAVAHRVVLVEKIEPTPAKYPRRWAKIQKAPL